MLTSYDALNRPELISENGRITRYGYDLGGRAVMLVAGNGQASSNNYDNLGRLVDRTLFRTTGMSNSEVLAEFSWEHDALGNVTRQLETWPGDASRSSGIRSTAMTYDANNRLTSETVVEDVSAETPEVTTTSYIYDEANNRLQKSVTGGTDPGVWHYTYNAANQLTHWEQEDVQNGTSLRSATLEYDDAGNRISQNVSITGGATGNGITPPPAVGGLTTYQWDAQDRLSSVTLPNGETHAYDYDYRTRRIGTHKLLAGVQQEQTAIVFAGGLSLAEYDSVTTSLPATPTVEYTRGPDMGGGVGGMLYSLRGGSPKYSLSNGRGDIVAQADASATLTWTASYEAYGRRTQETGTNEDKQRGNSKDEDPTGLLNEGFRYRDLETGVWLSRDPAGFVDGPNVYAYVKENPWSSFDAHGLYQTMPAAILHANGINTTSHEYQKGVQQGIAQGTKIGLVLTVGIGVTVATGGLATAASATVFGSGTLATSLSAAAISSAAGSIAANSTGNVLDGRPVGEGTLKAGATGALFGAAGQVIGNSALAFKQGMAEATGLAASAKATANTANAMAQANNATRGAAGGVASGEASATGLSHHAAGGVTPALNPRVQAAMDSTPNGMRSPFHGGCAEPQMASNLLNAGGSTEGAVSVVGAVRAPGSAANGRPMAPCSSRNEMNGKLGIIDMNATHASSGSGRAGGSAGAAATAAERERRRD